MGKANKVKIEFRDAVEMVDLIQTLKDIADNKFFTLMAQKMKFKRFGETFVDFFRLISFTKVEHLLISNDNPEVIILAITAEGSFLGEFNNRILRQAIKESEKHEKYRFVCVGSKGFDRLKKFTPDMKCFSNAEARGLYETSVEVKDYLVEEMMAGRAGKIIVCYSWPKTFDTQKVRIQKLLPCDELLSKQSKFSLDEKVIQESKPESVIGFLANLWVATRLYEIFIDTMIASSAAQAKFLDDSVEKMKKERTKVKIKYRKAKKSDIDKSLRETFSARMMTEK